MAFEISVERLAKHVPRIEDLRYWYPRANRKKLKRLQRLMRSHGCRRTETPYGFLLRYNTRRVLKSTFDAIVKSVAEKIVEKARKDANERFL